MATTKTAKKTTTKRTAEKTDARVLAWRISPKAFDAMTAACTKLGITKTTILNEGIVLALAKRAEKKAAEVFAAETTKEPPAG